MYNGIMTYGKSLGIDDLAFVEAKKLYGLREILSQRTQEDRELSIEEKDIEKRLDPFLSLEDVQSVLVAFWQISFDLSPTNGQEGRGELASISWEEDYHRVLGGKLSLLNAYIEKSFGPGYKSYVQVDTGPLYERGFALLSQRGFQGRNSAFIHKELGSFVTIGLLLINQKILFSGEERDNENQDSCGSCQACIRSCPGKAIHKDGWVDPRRCRSWISQKKEDLSEEEERILGNSIYGCDICQRVCPKNQGIQSPPIGSSAIRSVDLKEIQDISNKKFKEKYGHLSGSWRGAKIWRRNAKIIQRNRQKNGIIPL